MAGNGAQQSGYLQVQTTTDSRAEAMNLARAAVEARVAACGQVAGPIASTYWWNDELERAEEWFVFFKLPADRYEELAELIARKHSYDEPEIIALPIVAGAAGYLQWLSEETRPAEQSAGLAFRQVPGGALSGAGRRVPASDDRLVVFGAERADRAGVQPE